MPTKEKVCLIVIDGWGVREESHGNAILAAHTPNMDRLMKNSILLEACEENVGLPKGLVGNSDVGHTNIGAGRIVLQNVLRINKELHTGDILKNESFTKACQRAKSTSGGRIHLIGLCSDGGVHAHIDHILKIAETCKALGVGDCYLHCITDGRDTSPTSGVNYIDQIISTFKNNGYGKLSTVVGRYYAMDRDKRFERTKIAFDAFCYGVGTQTTEDKIIDLVRASYAKGKQHTDEYLTPFVFGDASYRIKPNDTVLFLNYRSDRMRQIVTCLGIKPPRDDCKVPENLEIFCMTEYDKTYTFKMLFPPIVPPNTLAEWLSKHKVPQLHVAESEKYPHVTFFFNGGIEIKYELEDHVFIDSPKVKTYDLQPEMSVYEVGAAVVKGIESQKYSFVVVNLAPPDMVGHTGVYEATVLACEATDVVIGQISKACEKFGFTLMVTSDHGNADQMYDENDKPFTAHSFYPVPLTITKGHKLAYPSDRKPALCDVAPTILDVMGLPCPPEFEGRSLLAH
ncbi:2,3-bisphosphoglycerate-independent phosphoglycerate mutase [Thelohanellus kitauei]|uniref:phosphoglycerate mutase (2,3-diphosphoglycerate-independent) n=1 Tax=Thelohanellus kitauei TaxID=669202 RepID=A0A0C2MSB4_THEKT|nr:2,3-bisphosphoglycerate-independent phosphoglycerate mutase [Thelohanellus kitauei]